MLCKNYKISQVDEFEGYYKSLKKLKANYKIKSSKNNEHSKFPVILQDKLDS